MVFKNKPKLTSKGVPYKYEERLCKKCGLKYTPMTNVQKYCSLTCQNRADYERNKEKIKQYENRRRERIRKEKESSPERLFQKEMKQHENNLRQKEESEKILNLIARSSEKNRNHPKRFCLWCKKGINNQSKGLVDFCNSKCYKRFNYYNNQEKRIQQTREWSLKNPEKTYKNKRKYYLNNYIPKRGELNEELKLIVKRLKAIHNFNVNKINRNVEKNQRRIKEYRSRPEVRKYMRLKWKEWAKKNETQIKIRFRIANAIRKKMNRLLSGKELIKENRKEISITEIAKYLLSRLPNDFYQKSYDIDHIKPLCSFDLTDNQQFKEAFALENHRWLLSELNRKKGREDRKLSINKK